MEAEERQRIDAKIAVLDASLASVFRCQCCGANAGIGAGGVCSRCRVVANQLRAEACMSDVVNGRLRADLVRDYYLNQT